MKTFPFSLSSTLTKYVRASTCSVAALFSCVATNVFAEPLVALTTNNSLLVLDTESPETTSQTVAVTGLQDGETLLAIDFRPADAALYGLGSSSRLYGINLSTGAASQVGSGQFSTVLSGTNFGFDFNPVADRARIVSDTGQNLRVDPNTGALDTVDTSVAYDASDVNTGATPSVVAAAYTNNFSDAATTTLLAVDSTLDILTSIGGTAGTPSPNTGGLFTLGSIGVDTTAEAGFDISSLTGAGLLSLSRSGETTSELYRIFFSSVYPVARLGQFGTDAIVRDIAAPIFETTAPGVSVAQPTTGSRIRTRRSNLTFSGSASDNVAVSQVLYRTRRNGNQPEYQAASGAASWSFPLRGLRPGITNVDIKAIDIFGNESAVTTIRVNRVR